MRSALDSSFVWEFTYKGEKLFHLTVELVRVKIIEPRHEISNNVVCATSKGTDQPVHMCSLIRAFASRLNNLRVLSY